MQYRPTIKTTWFTAEFWLTLLAAGVGACGVWYVYSLGLVRQLTDAHAHLNFSKMLVDSMTPGISQIGFWPPLLHVLMSPFAQIPSLYESGLAGAVVLLPFYVMGTVFTYKLVKLMTGNSWLSWTASIMFMANPYIIYYTAAPMMEVIFIGNLMGVAYFLASWLYRGRVGDLIGTAIFVTLATLSRFEGLVLIPLVSVIMVAELLRKKRRFSEIQAALILFLFVAVVGAATIFTYSWFFGGSPMAFTGGNWVRPADPNEGFTTEGNLIADFQYTLHASYLMLGQNLVFFALLSVPLLLMLTKDRVRTVSVLAVLASPVAFIVLALYSGSYNIAIPDLPPGKIFLNERYGLTWIGFLIVAPMLLLGEVLSVPLKRKWLKISAIGVSALAAVTLLASSGDLLYTAAKQDQYFVIRDNVNSPRSYHRNLAGFINAEYDYGKILITRADNDPVLGLTTIPLNEYIYEANYLYFQQSLDEPWLFARWVVMSKTADDEWAQANESVSKKWQSNEQFAYFYELAYENAGRQIYKIRDAQVAAYAAEHQIDLNLIPSVNPEITTWNPADFYSRLQLEKISLEKKNLTPKLE